MAKYKYKLPVFKTKRRTYKTMHKLLGGYVKNEVFYKFSIMAALERTTKNKLFSKIITEYTKDYDLEELSKILCDECLEAWLETVSINTTYSRHNLNSMWRTYKKKLQEQLKGLPKYFSNQVIEYIEKSQF